MSKSRNNVDNIAHEHSVLLNEYGRVQNRCSELVARQVDQIDALRADVARMQAEIMRLRAEVMRRDTALAYAQADFGKLQASIPGLPTRVSLLRRVETLSRHVQQLLRERLHGNLPQLTDARQDAAIAIDLREKSVLCIGQDAPAAIVAQQAIEKAGGRFLHHDGKEDADEAALEASLTVADMVICQTACISHSAYWRVQDHCKRTGKQCVLVNQPQAMHFVRAAAGRMMVADASAQASVAAGETIVSADK